MKFKKKHSKILLTYVNVSLLLLNKFTKYVSKFMKHLLVIQNIDPNTVPGLKFKFELDQVLNSIHENSYDQINPDSWKKMKFNEINKELGSDMSDQTLFQMTDINKLNELLPNFTGKELHINKSFKKVPFKKVSKNKK